MKKLFRTLNFLMLVATLSAVHAQDLNPSFEPDVSEVASTNEVEILSEPAAQNEFVESEAPAEQVALEQPASEQLSSEQASLEREMDSRSMLAATATTVEDSLEVQETVKGTKKSGGLLDALYPVDSDEAIAKGRFYGGTSLSLVQGNTDDDALNVIIGEIYEAYGYTFTVEAFGGYFIKDAMALGMRVGYSRTWYDIDFALMEDLLDMKARRKYVSNGFFFQPILKNYLKVFDSRTFYVFNETSVKVEYSYGISQSDDGEDMDKTKNKGWSINAGINPGICIMVLNRFAFETSVGLLGLSSSVIDVEENGETHSRVVYNIVNFTINLLALDFSLVMFF